MTNAARLLPQETTHPFWVENRLREEQFNKLNELVEKVQMVVRHYERYLHLPIGLKCCAELWENRLADAIWEAYSEMQEKVETAMYEFADNALDCAWLLYDAHGCNSAEFQRRQEDDWMTKRFAELHDAFIHDLDERFNPYDPANEDLPF